MERKNSSDDISVEEFLAGVPTPSIESATKSTKSTKRKSKSAPRNNNPMLAIVLHNEIRNSIAEKRSVCLLHTAAHAWYEGHVDAESSRHRMRSVAIDPQQPFPSPPFPANSAFFHEIVKETETRFSDHRSSPIAELAFVAALAWQAGYEEGLHCSGCKYPCSIDEATATAIRSGRMNVTLQGDDTARLTLKPDPTAEVVDEATRLQLRRFLPRLSSKQLWARIGAVGNGMTVAQLQDAIAGKPVPAKIAQHITIRAPHIKLNPWERP